MPYRRIQFAPGQYYHIYNRGSRRGPIFREEENYLFLLRRIKRYAAMFNITVVAYCLMPNHYHLLLRQDGPHAAGLLPQRVFNSYTKAFNRRYGTSGTLFEGRFKAIRVDKEDYLLHLCRYIHANTVKHGLVAALERWPYSNYLEWIGVRQGQLVNMAFVQAFFPQPTDYRRFVLDYVSGKGKLPSGIEPYLFD